MYQLARGDGSVPLACGRVHDLRLAHVSSGMVRGARNQL